MKVTEVRHVCYRQILKIVVGHGLRRCLEGRTGLMLSDTRVGQSCLRSHLSLRAWTPSRTARARAGFLILLAVAGLALGCAGRSAPREYTSSATPIDVQVGEQFVITLESNPTTGYSWQLGSPLDESVVKLVGSEFKQPDTKLIGAGGKESWTFQGVGPGRTSIRLDYVRPWETNVPPARSETFVVNVR